MTAAVGREAGGALPRERAGHAPPPWLIERRRMLVQGVEAGTWRTAEPPRTETLGGVRVLRFAPPGAPRGVVLHLHGGGFRLGCPEMEGPFAAALAARCGVEVVAPAYRLAPEHPFPSGLVDAYSVAGALAEAGAGPLVISGASAGGGLAAGVAALCRKLASPPRGLVLLSAWLDLTVTSPAYRANAASDPLFSQGAAEEAAKLYLQGLSPRHSLASPLFAELAGFPPALVSIGEEEVLADDGRSFHEALRAAGVQSRFVPVAGMQHVAVTRGLELPGAAETFEAVADFVDGVVAGA